VDWIYLAQERDHWRALVNTVMDLRVPQNVGNFLASRVTVTFSRRVLRILFHGVSSALLMGHKACSEQHHRKT